ncbi:MAG: DUF4190 domain-containing protein [Bifidobacteriaceae bacterium]|nr:DUF4190 domain-containing protein [Bifidobacteriaceae bacterium]
MSEQSPYGPAGPQPVGPYAEPQPYAARPFDPPTSAYPPAAYPQVPSQPYDPYSGVYGGWSAAGPSAIGPYAPYPAYQGFAAARPAKNGMGVASLVLSIAGVTVLAGLAIGSILGVIFGHIGLAAAGRGEANNKGIALAGVIIGYIGIALSLLIWGLVAAVGSSYWGGYTDYISAVGLPALAGAVPPAV